MTVAQCQVLPALRKKAVQAMLDFMQHCPASHHCTTACCNHHAAVAVVLTHGGQVAITVWRAASWRCWVRWLSLL